VPGLRGIHLRLGFSPGHPVVRQILALYAPVAAGLVISEVGVLIDRNLAWQTGDASVATMRYATNLVQLPLGLVGTATSLAALPLLSRLVDDPDGFRSTLASGMRLALLAIVPATAFLVVFAVPTFQLIYQRGAFDATATSATATAFLYYAPQLPFVAVDQLLIYAFYARRNTVTPMLVGLGGVGVYLGTALLLIGPFHAGLAGLILANTLQNSLHAVVLFALLSQAAGSLAAHRVGQTLVRAILAGALSGLAGLALERTVPAPSGVVSLVGYLALAGVLVFAGYLMALRVLGVEEIVGLPRAIQGRLRSRVSL
jgi:putative peptidoglycan lipid II flippase